MQAAPTSTLLSFQGKRYFIVLPVDLKRQLKEKCKKHNQFIKEKLSKMKKK